jgi:DNA replication protein DnaC
LLDYLALYLRVETNAEEVWTMYDDRFIQLKEADLLVLDDYGAQQEEPDVRKKMFQLLNYRYNRCLPTVITSNNIGLVGIDPLIASRMNDRELVTLVRMEGARDYRVYRDSQDGEEE